MTRTPPLHKTYEMIDQLCLYREGFFLRAIVKILSAEHGDTYTFTQFQVLAVVKRAEDHHHLELVGSCQSVSELNGPEWNQEWRISPLKATELDEAIKETDPRSTYEWSTRVIQDHTENPFAPRRKTT